MIFYSILTHYFIRLFVYLFQSFLKSEIFPSFSYKINYFSKDIALKFGMNKATFQFYKLEKLFEFLRKFFTVNNFRF